MTSCRMVYDSTISDFDFIFYCMCRQHVLFIVVFISDRIRLFLDNFQFLTIPPHLLHIFPNCLFRLVGVMGLRIYEVVGVRIVRMSLDTQSF